MWISLQKSRTQLAAAGWSALVPVSIGRARAAGEGTQPRCPGQRNREAGSRSGTSPHRLYTLCVGITRGPVQSSNKAEGLRSALALGQAKRRLRRSIDRDFNGITSETEVTDMTIVSPHRDPPDVKLSTADEEPRHKGPWRRVFLLSAILGWSAMAACWLTGMAGEMFASVTLLTVSVSAFVAAGLAATFLPPAVPHAPVIRQQRAGVTT